tara:strand:- start:242 stop:811 length:570 start_codon:yes stop_codon:yes gene_type:complete
MTCSALVGSFLSDAGTVQAGYVPDDLKVAQIILVIAAGLSIPGLVKRAVVPAMAALAMGLGAGMMFAPLLGTQHLLPVLLIGMSVALGVSVATRFRPERTVGLFIMLVTGIAFGFACVPAGGDFPAALGLAATNLIAGTGAMICLAWLVSGLVAEPAPAWRAIAIRIAGSWIVAISVLLIAVSWQANRF